MGMAIPLVIGAVWFWAAILRDLPDISEIENYNFKQATTITDRHGKVLYTLFEENRQYIPFEDMSDHFVQAIVATEDQRFWTNPGIDIKGTLRA
jgi:penicillin-binding protein 1A